jgi:hypothetical protein
MAVDNRGAGSSSKSKGVKKTILSLPKDPGAALATARITEHKTYWGQAAHQATHPKDMADARRPTRQRSYEVNKAEVRSLVGILKKATKPNTSAAGKGKIGKKKK